jgi:hypothetical protein
MSALSPFSTWKPPLRPSTVVFRSQGRGREIPTIAS